MRMSTATNMGRIVALARAAVELPALLTSDALDLRGTLELLAAALLRVVRLLAVTATALCVSSALTHWACLLRS